MQSDPEIISRIQKARCDLYVYGQSAAKEKWRDLLDEAYEALLAGNRSQAMDLVSRCEGATSSLWLRIDRWRKIQIRLTAGFAFFLVAQMAVILWNFETVFNGKLQLHYTSIVFGLLGGTTSTLLSLGDNLNIEGSNRLGLIKSVVRPIVGCFNALVAILLLTTGIITIPGVVVSNEIAAIVGVGAGLTERFVTNKLSSVVT